MPEILKGFKALSDATRLRIMALLEKHELSVYELQEITRMGQSRISTHLSLLVGSGLAQSRREGKRIFYKLNQDLEKDSPDFIGLAIRGAQELPGYAADQINLKRIVTRRREQALAYFDQIAGRFDRVYGPGQVMAGIWPVAFANYSSADGSGPWLRGRIAERTVGASLQKSNCDRQLR